MIIIKAQKQHLKDLVPVFDGCRVFYNQTSKQGIGVALLKQAKKKAKEDAYKFVVLQTETKNPT